MNAQKEKQNRQVDPEVFQRAFPVCCKPAVQEKQAQSGSRGCEQRTPLAFQYKQHPLSMEEQQEDEEEIWQLLEKAVRGACEKVVETRVREGEALKCDLLAKLDEMLRMTAFIEERSPQIMAEYRQKLEAKVQDLLTDAQTDESRIAMEVTLFADKICVDEEIVRLRSHVEATKAALESGGSVGRKLDFIAQEMNREANTTLSKANDLEISNCAIDLKTEIEKVREQIQNIE